MRSRLLFILSLILIFGCRGPVSPDIVTGPYPVTGIDNDQFYQELGFSQSGNLTVKASGSYSPIYSFHQEFLPDYLHLDPDIGTISCAIDEIPDLGSTQTVDVDFWTSDDEGRLSERKAITLNLLESIGS